MRALVREERFANLFEHIVLLDDIQVSSELGRLHLNVRDTSD